MRSSAPDSQLISRRTLVRAGATAAWSVPLVQVVAAAPAIAASTDPLITWAQWNAHYQSGSTTLIDLTLQVTNSGGADTKGAFITVKLPMAAQALTSVAGGTASGSSDTWTLQPTGEAAANGGSIVMLVTFEVGSAAGGTGSVTFNASNIAAAGVSHQLPIQQTSAAGTAFAWDSLGGIYPAGDPTRLTVSGTIRNSGSTTATNPSVVLVLPVAASAVPASTSDWMVSGSGKNFTLSAKQNLPAGSSNTRPFSFTFPVSSDSGGALQATAKASNANSLAKSIVVKQATPAVLSLSALTITRDSNKKSVLVKATITNTAPTEGGRSSGQLTFAVDTSKGKRTAVPTVTIDAASSSGWSSPAWSSKIASATGPSLAPQGATTIGLLIDYKDNTQAQLSTYDFGISVSCSDGATASTPKNADG